jgi:hypothetical protein
MDRPLLKGVVMRKRIVLLTLALAAVLGAEAGLFAPSTSAASGCWQVCVGTCCNTCCKLQGGGTVCTQRACP